MSPRIPYYKKGFKINGDWIRFSEGGFDEWCVYINNSIPLDKDYFTSLEDLKNEYGRDLVYSSFQNVYDGVHGDWTRKDREKCYILCEKTSKDYDKPTLLLWITLYMTMLAEEKKDKAILGKKIKRLGVYNLLYDEYPVDYIVKYMRNMRWYKLKELMIQRGIYYDK